MASFSFQPFTASPTLVLQPQSHRQIQLAAGTFGRNFSSHMQPITKSVNAPVSPARPGCRKRSRDEASSNLQADPQPRAAAKVQKDSSLGEGMVLTMPASGHVADASVQSSTSIEEEMNDDARKRLHEHNSRPGEMRSHKSQRLDRTADHTWFGSTFQDPATDQQHNNLPGVGLGDAVIIDNFTIHLGIGWRRISEDEYIQAAARGWARFIENNFGLSQVRICLESKGLQSYLVEAFGGYFLFTENLRQGRLVSRTAEGALHNLRASPPTFEGPELNLVVGENQRNGSPMGSAMAVDP